MNKMLQAVRPPAPAGVEEDAFFMAEALHQARQAYRAGEVPVGALVVLEGQVIARAHNRVQALQQATAHAELLALQAAFDQAGAKYLPQATLYVTLEPCPMCAGALYWAQVGRLCFGASDAQRGYQRWATPLLHPKTRVAQGLLAAQSTQLLHSFFHALRQSPAKIACAAHPTPL